MSTIQAHPAAFDAIAAQYDELFTNSVIGRAQRDAVWDVLRRHLRPGSSVLELNCGTGEDALFLAKRGMTVVACDISAKMIEVASTRGLHAGNAERVEFVALAIEDIAALQPARKFDAVFSNFSGLNCVADLRKTATDLAKLLRPGSQAILCLSNKYCLWETIWYLLHVQWRKAFRRWSSRPVAARIGSKTVMVRYPSTAAIIGAFSPVFRVKGVHGIGIAVPPSYLEPWIRRIPRGMTLLRRLDRRATRWPLLRSLGDHVVLVLERTAKA